jgi:molybdate transport system substrate-binding protein
MQARNPAHPPPSPGLLCQRQRRAGAIHLPWAAFLGSAALLAVLVALVVLLRERPQNTAVEEPLLVYCAAGIKPPVEEAAREYAARYGVPVELQYGGSQTLLANAEISATGDLYIPGDDAYIEAARRKGLVAESIPLARMRLVLAVARGNPHRIVSLSDLLARELRIAVPNPDAAASGKLARERLERSGQWETLRARATVFKPTVNEVANDIEIGAVDAGLVWDATVRQYSGLEAVAVPAFEGAVAHVTAAVLSHCRRPAAALRFARYLSARDRGLEAFARHGYSAIEGDEWTEAPELRIFAGAMLRPAIEETLSLFERREGVRVTRVYNGCGMLVAQLKLGEAPDAYFACETSFFTCVSELFLEAVDVSQNELAILVPKENPRRLRTLADLAAPGLRLGVGNEQQSALGALTQETLSQANLRAALMKNVTVESPTGDYLVNQLLTGSLDAVIAYVTNAAAAKDEIAAIPLDLPSARALQPLAVGRSSRQKHLAMRLKAALLSPESRRRFEAAGFHWQAPPE